MTTATSSPNVDATQHVRIELGERSYDIAIGAQLLADPATYAQVPSAAMAIAAATAAATADACLMSSPSSLASPHLRESEHGRERSPSEQHFAEALHQRA